MQRVRETPSVAAARQIDDRHDDDRARPSLAVYYLSRCATESTGASFTLNSSQLPSVVDFIDCNISEDLSILTLARQRTLVHFTSRGCSGIASAHRPIEFALAFSVRSFSGSEPGPFLYPRSRRNAAFTTKHT
jgi:hypothetical protein